jgi:hypothetical protein
LCIKLVTSLRIELDRLRSNTFNYKKKKKKKENTGILKTSNYEIYKQTAHIAVGTALLLNKFWLDATQRKTSSKLRLHKLVKILNLLKICASSWSLAKVIVSSVTDDPGSKPNQKYARQRDRQNYIQKNKVKILDFGKKNSVLCTIDWYNVRDSTWGLLVLRLWLCMSCGGIRPALSWGLWPYRRSEPL